MVANYVQKPVPVGKLMHRTGLWAYFSFYMYTLHSFLHPYKRNFLQKKATGVMERHIENIVR